MAATVESEGDGPPVTTLSGGGDQAAGQALLRRPYSLGLPLIPVNWVPCDLEDMNESKKTPP